MNVGYRACIFVECRHVTIKSIMKEMKLLKIGVGNIFNSSGCFVLFWNIRFQFSLHLQFNYCYSKYYKLMLPSYKYIYNPHMR